jgi:dTDP-4-amino-4,6-dideoxygalactose transaminase
VCGSGAQLKSPSVQTRPAPLEYPEGMGGDARAKTNGAADWPFWKTIPRFAREYSTGDLAEAVKALAGSPDHEETEWEKYFSAASGLQFARSGKESLYLILRSLGLRAGSLVGVPLYCCEAVFAAIAAAGHIPVFLDIDLNSYALDEESVWRCKNELDALVVVHTFGYPANLTRIQECLENRDTPVIEDCAHSLFSDFMGSPTGSWTHASFFTFGMHKPAPAGGGGMLVINNPALANAALQEAQFLPAESKWRQLQHAGLCWARSLSYHRGVYGALLSSFLAGKRDVDAAESLSNESRGQFGCMTAAQIRLVDKTLIGKRVRDFKSSLPALARNSGRIRDAVAETSLALLEEPSHGTWNHFLLPVRYESSAQCDSGRQFLLRKRVDTSPLYRNCVRNARKYGYRSGCPQSELVSQTVCTVPNHEWLSDDEVEHIGAALRLSAGIK